MQARPEHKQAHELSQTITPPPPSREPTSPDDPSQRSTDSAAAGSVTWRSITLGSITVILLAALTYYNDFVVNNTFTFGNALPTMVVFLLLVAVFVNAALLKWKRNWSLRPGEFAVALGMLLVSASLPSVGWFRYLPGHLIQHYSLAGTDSNYQKVAEEMQLPEWVFPAVTGNSHSERANDPVIRGFITRAPVDEPTFANRWAAVPWAAWSKPAIGWGIFTMFLMCMAIFMMVVFRRQWVENERLPFPLATIYLSLIEPPERGRFLNRLLSNRIFWMGVALVVFIHGFNGLHAYFPKWPEIPLKYDLNAVFADDPWKSMDGSVKAFSDFSFTVPAVLYFAETRVSFSIWFIFMLRQIVKMWLGAFGEDLTEGMGRDQMLGAVIMLGLAAIWIGRSHLLMVAKQMFRKAAPDEARGRYLPYWAAGWGFVICLVGCVAWLSAAGMSVVGASVVMVLIVLLYIVVARMVAETGLVYPLLEVFFERTWVYSANLPGGTSARATMPDYWYSSTLSGVATHDLRNCMPVFASHALRVTDETATEGTSAQSERSGPNARLVTYAVTLLIVVAVTYVVAGAGMLYSEYSYGSSLNKTPETPINLWGTDGMPKWRTIGQTTNYLPPAKGPTENHNRLGNLTFGGAMATFLTFMRLRFTGWPLHPVGFLLLNSWGIHRIWASAFVGWLVKVMIVKFGGYALYMRLRPFMIGLILGEAAMAATFLIVNLILLALGVDYVRIIVLLS